ncbi:response regulator transcription factor [Gorillibacterium timonense]|uniref:response regulator transcription factor n=1 Tax=Gorillibacterium timonense TaxID=1689269 RepID=UPI00071DD081|nr:response regulator [Gorillibacterium timonense]
MRILIADDEPLVRIGLKSVIDWKGNGMEIVGEAADGAETLEQISSLSPDVVFLDIKMPKKDGIAVMKEMRQLGSTAKVIILSSFDDIAYVKEAMKLGAVDYFHKPAMNEEEITAVLKELQSEATQGGFSPKQPRADHPASSKADDLREGLRGNSGVMRRSSHLKEAGIYVLLFSIKHYGTVIKRYPHEQPHILPDTVDNIVAEVLGKEKETEYLRIDDRVSAVLISNSELKSLLASLNRVNGLVQTLTTALKRFVNVDAVFGISDWFSSFGGLETGYAQAQTALEQAFYMPEPSVFYFHFCKPVDPSSLEQSDVLLASMKNALREGNFKKFKEILERWQKLVERARCLNEQEARKVYEGLLFMLDERKPDAEAAGTGETFAELSASFNRVIERATAEKDSSELKLYSLLIRNVIRYLQEHYTEDLSLKLLAEQFQVSPNYVSRLFKQEVGRGIFEYINEIRIEKAKALLKDYRYKIYEIAEMVGFNSQTHFSTVFQRLTGVSPKEYRNDEG